MISGRDIIIRPVDYVSPTPPCETKQEELLTLQVSSYCRLRRWPSIQSTFIQSIVFAGLKQEKRWDIHYSPGYKAYNITRVKRPGH